MRNQSGRNHLLLTLLSTHLTHFNIPAMRTALTTARTAVRQQYAVRGLSSIACQAPKPRAALRLPPPTLSRSTLRPPLPHLQPNRWLSSRPSSSSSKPSTDDAQPANVDGREAKTLLIVYHSLTGGAKQMATAAYDSAVAAAKEEWEGEADEAVSISGAATLCKLYAY